jgi:hypothetical protein
VKELVAAGIICFKELTSAGFTEAEFRSEGSNLKKVLAALKVGGSELDEIHIFSKQAIAELCVRLQGPPAHNSRHVSQRVL